MHQNLAVTFAVTTGNAGALSPQGNRPDLYVDEFGTRARWIGWSAVTPSPKEPLHHRRVRTSAGLVGDHSEGVEPTPGSFTATDTTVTPGL
jgi:hypothetical protein